MTTFHVDPNGNSKEIAHILPHPYDQSHTYAEVNNKFIGPGINPVVGEKEWSADRRVTNRTLVDQTTFNVYSDLYDYNGNGKKTSHTNAMGMTTTYTWHPDFKDRITSVENPAGIVEFEYDSRGNPVKKTDQLGEETIYAVDAWGLRPADQSRR